MKKNNSLLVILTAIISFILVCGLGFFAKAASATERHSYQLSLSSKEVTVVADTSKYFFPKKLIQPNVIYVTAGHRGGVINDTENDIKLRVDTEDTHYSVSISSKMNGFDSKTGLYSVPLEAGNQVTFDITIRIPRSSLKEAKGDNVVFHFIDDNTGMVLSDLIVKIA